MSPESRIDDPRACPRCGTTVRSEQGYGASGVTYLWRCDCGWSSIRTVSAARSGARKQRSGVYARAAAVPAQGPPKKHGSGQG